MEKHECWPELKEYINFLIQNSDDKIPVLQFNRMDLRLSWLKNNFPNSLIINIQRQPYPQWISSRKHIKDESMINNESYEDAYDLMQWAIDLSEKFPMLQNPIIGMVISAIILSGNSHNQSLTITLT